MKVLIACEESQRVCIAFRERGHEAYSCDIQDCSGGHPEWHIKGDALKCLQGGQMFTSDGQNHYIDKWDLLIAHPPCTYLSNVAGIHFSLEHTPAEKVVLRWKNRAQAARQTRRQLEHKHNRPRCIPLVDGGWRPPRPVYA